MSDPGTPFRKVSGGVTAALRVTPKAGRNRVEGTMTDGEGGVRLKVAVSAAPEDGKANQAVVRLLARQWRIAKSHISVRAGARSRDKTILIAGESGDILDKLRASGPTGHG